MKSAHAYWLTCALLFSAGVGSIFAGQSAHDLLENLQLPRPLKVAVPAELGGWSGVDTPLSDSAFKQLRLDDYVRRNYTSADGETVQLYIAYHGNKRRGLDTLYHNATVCMPSAGYAHIDTELEEVTLHDKAKSIATSRYIFAKGGDRVAILSFFKIGDEFLDQSPRNKSFWLLQHKILPETPGAFVQVQVIVPIRGEDMFKANELQSRFLQVFGRSILEAID